MLMKTSKVLVKIWEYMVRITTLLASLEFEGLDMTADNCYVY